MTIFFMGKSKIFVSFYNHSAIPKFISLCFVLNYYLPISTIYFSQVLKCKASCACLTSRARQRRVRGLQSLRGHRETSRSNSGQGRQTSNSFYFFSSDIQYSYFNFHPSSFFKKGVLFVVRL